MFLYKYNSVTNKCLLTKLTSVNRNHVIVNTDEILELTKSSKYLKLF